LLCLYFWDQLHEEYVHHLLEKSPRDAKSKEGHHYSAGCKGGIFAPIQAHKNKKEKLWNLKTGKNKT
jgi:hypothetical protein